MLDPKKKYLQIALNSTLDEAQEIISKLPVSDRILIEAGTPLIKRYGAEGIAAIKNWYWQKVTGVTPMISSRSSSYKYFGLTGLLLSALQKQKVKSKEIPKTNADFEPYVVADLKCMDRGETEVEIAANGGANAAVALGHAPLETLDAFIQNCKKSGVDSMIDMMNVDFPLTILRNLEELPQVVILHRGVDEEHFNKEKEIPFYEISRIKSEYEILIAIAGGDTFHEVQQAAFNDADIVVVWKSFYKSTADTAKIADDFLKEIR
ncbi:MAG: hypothetical protein COT24_00045 [Candidatus Kerfeldbacteria bacterium CG08_land_8_20_14_0_20_40_16]|uniref:Orotidine 5'-phosphate decarboxylase domain-containing protein n=1 Tax=Candidatus Kerfeldbacteria bacterium CG08_land_8_20_14_0_20_40_16 TaxID=2014244 RepID=A0A2H0YX94_9BACT|nr:MAG: hypothetical protein COT24_00045 [Candidatus Kerfeldbacteria bacterium CG08_land_8_20_14_0_20_40_16]